MSKNEEFEVKEVVHYWKETQCVLSDKRTIELLKNIVRAYHEITDPESKIKSINIKTIELYGDVEVEREGLSSNYPITIHVSVKEKG